jgi:hypothetical protein
MKWFFVLIQPIWCPATPQPQLHNSSSVALQAFHKWPEATTVLGALPSEAKIEAEASTRAGMQPSLTVATAVLQATAVTAAAVASSTAAGALEAMQKGGLGTTQEAASSLAGRPLEASTKSCEHSSHCLMYSCIFFAIS